MATILMGYDIETGAVGDELSRIGDHPFSELADIETLPQSMGIIERIHGELAVPATLFICGRTLVLGLSAIQPFATNPLFDMQQHTYSHLLFKEDRWMETIFPAASAEALEHELMATSTLLAKHLGVDCIGLRAPHGYHLGLSDRPEYLALLKRTNIKFVSSWGRNAAGTNPTPFSVQPFWYEAEGFPEILELPFQFWLDNTWFEEFGPTNADGYVSALCEAVDEIVEGDLVYGVCFHCHSMLRYDENRTGWVRRFLEYALKKEVRVMSYRQYYEECAANRTPSAKA